MSRLRALLLGLGQIGCGYDLNESFQRDQPCSGPVTLTHARALACHPEVDLVGAVDPDPAARERFSRIYQCPAWPDLSAFGQAASAQQLDLVVVAVPPLLQPSLVEQLLARFRPRMLLLEKPVAINAAGADQLRRVCESRPDLLVAVNYIRRYLPAVLRLQTHLQEGELGELLHGRLTYGKGLLSNGSHFVNLAEAWLGPLRLTGPVKLGPSFADFDHEANLTLTAEGHSEALLQVCGIGSAGLRAGELDLWFRGGRLCWENSGRCLRLWRPVDAAPGDTHRPLQLEPQQFDTGMSHYQHQVLESLVCHLKDPADTPIHCDLKAGLQTLNLLEGALNAEC